MSYDKFVIDLGKSIVDLFQVMSTHHGIYRGTHEAVLFEAQGGQIGPAGFSHLTSLQEGIRAISTRQDALKLAIDRMNGVDPSVASKVRDICDPLLKQSQQYVQTARQTESVAAQLRASDPVRFQGVMLGQGGMGTGVARSSASLASNQLNQQAQQLASRGITDPRLVPASRPALQPVMNMIKDLPTTVSESKEKLMAVIIAMRNLLLRALRVALAAGRTALAAALGSIESALTAFGSRFTTIPMADMEFLKKLITPQLVPAA